MPRAPNLAGRVLDDRYELHEMIGEGAFGRVYRGLDKRLGRAVAVKVIKPWWAEDSAWVERFEREAQMLARVNHPGIVQVFDIGDAEQGPYYVAELVQGESLADRLRRGPLPVEHARDVAEQLCRALACAHRQGVMHCDVKPANVLLGADGAVKVGDFGLARLAEGTSQMPSMTVAGTPRYMSPEQARGRATTAATDVYSTGVVLYEMLAGSPPFVDGSAVELGLRHLQDPPPPLPARVPPVLRHTVERALAKDPAKRYPDCDAMAAALCDADSDDKPLAPSPAAPRGSGVALVPRAPARTGSARPERQTIDLAEAGRRQFAPSGPAPSNTRVLVRAPELSSVRTGRGPGVPLGRRRALPVLAGLVLLAGVALAVRLLTTLSAGPAPVAVPGMVGASAGSAETRLADAGLRYRVSEVAAPGTSAGVVMRQTPEPAAAVARGATVALSVSEIPRWRPLTTFAGVNAGKSVAFRVLGTRWRVSYSMAIQGLCLLIVVCEGPSAEAVNLSTGSGFGGFELDEGQSRTHTFDSGPGLYNLVVSGGRDSARWSMTVEDYY